MDISNLTVTIDNHTVALHPVPTPGKGTGYGLGERDGGAID